MFCRHCGSGVGEDAVFCGSCGGALRPVAAPHEVTQPLPAVDDSTSGSRGWLIAALVTLGVIASSGALIAVLYFTGALASFGIGGSPERSFEAEATPVADEVVAGEDVGGAESDDESAPVVELGDSESYDALVDHYARLRDLHAAIGIAFTDSYGGTGFAYDVFNKKIGVADANVRSQLVDECQELLDRVQAQRAELERLQIAAAYSSQRDKLLELYGLLEARMKAMLGAAEAAVDDPAETNWRPILSPASTETRVRFESEFPGAEPYR